VRLAFDAGPAGQKKHWRENRSAVAAHSGTLFAPNDENPAVCRLIAEGDGYRHSARPDWPTWWRLARRRLRS
jgi:hypothetical protein